jgi:hypothetical protein
MTMTTDVQKTEAELQAETRQHQAENSKAFLAMEPQVHDLSRLASITYEYVLNMFKVGHPVAAPRDMELREEEQENILFLLGQIVKASARLPEFYNEPDSAEAED